MKVPCMFHVKKMLRLFHFSMLISILCFKQVVATSWCGKNPYRCSSMRFEGEMPSNGSSQSIMVEPPESLTGVQHRAIYVSSSSYDTKLYGTIATLSVHELPTTKKGQGVMADVAVTNFQRGQTDSVNAIHAGWAILPSFYGDNKTHFFVRWTADGYRGTGCIDLKCDGFVPVNYAPITPGDILEGKSKISIKIFKKLDDGDWWLYFGYDGENITPVGFWPKNLFNNLANYANGVSWGGFAGSYAREPTPPMGNGHWPGKNSAFFQDIQFVDINGYGYSPAPWPAGVHSDVSHKKCYQVSVFTNGMFYYGGPGGCTD